MKKLLITLLAISSVGVMHAAEERRSITLSAKPNTLTPDQATLQKMYDVRNTENPKFLPIQRFNLGDANKLGIYQKNSKIAQIRDSNGNIAYKFKDVEICWSTKNNPCTENFNNPNRGFFGYMWQKGTDANTFTALHGIPAAIDIYQN